MEDESAVSWVVIFGGHAIALISQGLEILSLTDGSAGEGEAELADFTPAFLWLLRDFYLQLEEEGRQVRDS